MIVRIFIPYIFMLFIINTTVMAENVFTPSLKLGLGYSDNIDQDHEREKNSFIAEISPRIKYTQEGARFKSNVDYSLNAYAYSNSSVTDKNNWQHALQANMQSELVENLFFIDADASITQELINKRNGETESNTGVDNLTETYTYGINPYWTQGWKGYAESIVSYEYNEVLYNDSVNNGFDNNLANDSDENKVQILINNGRKFNRIIWKIDYNYSKVNYNDTIINSKDSESESVLGELGYEIDNEFTIMSKFGYENYDQSTDQPSVNNNGSFSGLGFIWTPSSRTYLEVTMGNRFYGDAYDLIFKHQGDILGINLTYNESVTSARDQYREDNANTNTVDSASINQSLDSLYLSKNYNAELTYQLKKLGLQLGAYHDDRDYGDGKKILNEKVYGTDFGVTYQEKKSTYRFNTHFENRESNQLTENGKDYGVDLSWDLKIGKRMNAMTSLSYLKQKYDNYNDDNEWALRWQLNRQLSRNLSGNVRLSHRKKTSDIKYDEYTENTIFVNLNKSFR